MSDERGEMADVEIDEILGGDPAECAERQLEQGDNLRAAATCRFALNTKEEPDDERLEELLMQSGEPPEGWQEALEEFASDPSVEAWDELVEFVPDDVLYTRMRHAVHFLHKRGISADMLFRLATRHGTLPDAFELADSGEVEPTTVLEVAEQKPAAVRGMWYAVAARAFAGRDDTLGAVRLIRRALDEAREVELVDMHVYSIWTRASESERDQIRAVWEPQTDFGSDL